MAPPCLAPEGPRMSLVIPRVSSVLNDRMQRLSAFSNKHIISPFYT